MRETSLIIGDINIGKTTTVLFNEVKKAIEKGENLCLLDNRDEYFKTFYNTLKVNNYNTLVLNLKEPSKSNGFNPLNVPYDLYKEGKKDEAIELINNLALEIFKDKNSADPFWSNMAANYFMGLVLILFNEGKETEINLGSVQVMMNQGEEKYNESNYLKSYLDGLDVTNVIYSLLSPIVYAPSDTKMSIIVVCKQKLNIYIYREELLNLLNTNDINVRNLKEKTAIIIIAPKQTDIANILLNQLIEVSNLKFTYILDNFDRLNSLIDFSKYLEEASYENNKFIVAVHSIDEIEELYGKHIVSKFGNLIKMDDDKCIEGMQNIPVGNDNNYPTLNMSKHNYLDFKKVVK